MNIGIYIYDNAEVLDFSGPFEVFSVANRLAENDWNVFLISETGSLVTARGNFLIQPHYSISNHPGIDVFVVVGGIHTEEIKKDNVINWVLKISEKAELVASVCTGCFLLAEAGLLNGLSVTTHWEDIPDLKSQYPLLTVIENQRWVREGKYITSGGISAGIDMSLFLVSDLVSLELARKTAKQMEYRWQPGA
jgi:transcriptional regulator GlxA family with amidase domain